MASASFSLSRGTLIDQVEGSGSQTITEAANAPGAGDIEVRVNVAQGWTKKEIKIALDAIFRFLRDTTKSTSIPL